MSLYLKLHEKAASLYPQDEKARDDFVEGFVTKVANILTDLKYDASKIVRQGGKDVPTTLGESFADNFWSRGVGTAAGKAAVGTALGLGFTGIMSMAKVVSDHQLHNNYLKALNEARQTNAVIRQAPAEKVLSYGNTIFKFAPHVASDTNLLSHVLANAIHGESVDTAILKMITDLESRYVDTKGPSNFNPKNFL